MRVSQKTIILIVFPKYFDTAHRILAAHILDGATGWYMGKVQNFGVGPSWKQPDSTHIVVYTCAQTKTKALEGRVACALTADNYGAAEWWLLLDPVAVAS